VVQYPDCSSEHSGAELAFLSLFLIVVATRKSIAREAAARIVRKDLPVSRERGSLLLGVSDEAGSELRLAFAEHYSPASWPSVLAVSWLQCSAS